MINTQNGNWFKDKGDETVALDWEINQESMVWEIGGFEGRWAKQMEEKYNPHITIFEPQLWAVERMQAKFQGNPKVAIRPFGLWVIDARMSLHKYETDGCSILGDGETAARADFLDAYSVKQDRQDVDVCLMNIEGAEYALLPYMIGMDMMQNFRYFWCQFHPGLVQDGDRRSNTLFKMLAHTHHKLWDYFPTAVAWERR